MISAGGGDRRCCAIRPDGGSVAIACRCPAPWVSSPVVDLARYGNSRFLYGTQRFTNFIAMLPVLQGLVMVPYVAGHDLQDPVLSTMYADLRGFSPTLCGLLSAALLALVCNNRAVTG
jgi:hypothetical protein